MVNILGANSVSGGYEIDNSLRFNDDDSPMLSRTMSGGNQQIHTLSTWVKRSNLSTGNQRIFSSDDEASADFRLRFTSADVLMFSDTYTGNSNTYTNLITTRVFRDTSAFFHIMIAIDTTQGTAANRVKIYVNGVQETSFSTAQYPQQNDNFGFGRNGKTFEVGASLFSNSPRQEFDGYFAETYAVDGAQKAPSDFGEFDDNSVWIPKAYEGSYGTNGFLLEYKETGTSQNSSGIGADTSGNDNHFAVTNLAATDVTTDTPTNNFATFNPIFSNARSGFTATATLREGNTGATGVNTSGNVSTIGFDKGKWYWEIKIVTRVSNDLNIGIVSIPGPHSGVSVSKTMMWQSQDDLYFNNNQTNATKTADLVSFDDGDIVAVALDLDASTPNVILYKNGTALNSGNAYNFNANERDGGNFIFPQVTVTNTSDNVLINFGNPAFAISSGNADANGYGNFEYSPTIGGVNYYSLCTKNLAEFG